MMAKQVNPGDGAIDPETVPSSPKGAVLFFPGITGDLNASEAADTAAIVGTVTTTVGDTDKAATDKEKKRQEDLRVWLDTTCDAAINAMVEDTAVPFIDADNDAETDAYDLQGEYDPVVDADAGLRLSDSFKLRARAFGIKVEGLKRLYQDSLKKKWDAWEAEGNKIPTAPKGESYGQFVVTRKGIWIRTGGGDIEDLGVWRRIIRTDVRPEAISYDTSSRRNYQHHFSIVGETPKNVVLIDAKDLRKNADRAINELTRAGVVFMHAKEALPHIIRFLRFRPSKRILRVSRTGWLEHHGCWVYLLGDEAIGAPDGSYIMLDRVANFSNNYGFHRAGTLDQWHKQIAEPLAREPNVVLAIGTALASAVWRWVGESSGGFHFYCKTSKAGKTLIIVLAQSVWGRPFIPGSADEAGFGFDWNTTPSRFEERAAQRNDNLLSVDGVEGGNPKQVGNTVYMLNSQGRGRMGRRETPLNVVTLSTGEVSIAEFLGDAREGQLVRLADIPVEIISGSGNAFVHFLPHVAGRRFYGEACDCHGVLGYAWAQYLAKQTPENFQPRLDEFRKAFLAKTDVNKILNSAQSQVVTVIHRFAGVAAVSAMVIEDAGLLPWSIVDTDACIIDCMRRWLGQRGNVDLGVALAREIEQRRRTFAATAMSRLVRLGLVNRKIAVTSVDEQAKLEGVQKAKQFIGYVRDGQILLTTAAAEDLWRGLDLKAVKQYLLDRRLLIPDGKGETPSTVRHLDGAIGRFYVLAMAFIDDVTP
jgi:uncharacterized protein (DUF927 family)